MVALPPEFYARPVLQVARELIGATIEHGDTAGVIVETEAYHESEPACHAFVGITPRTRTLFGPPGRAYVYRSYGIHALLNAVCEPEGVGAAVLIRALEPVRGIERMRARRGVLAAGPVRDRDLCSGPGKLTQALGISLTENGSDLQAGPVLILQPSAGRRAPAVVEGTRIGISRAIELRWRFCAAESIHGVGAGVLVAGGGVASGAGVVEGAAGRSPPAAPPVPSCWAGAPVPLPGTVGVAWLVEVPVPVDGVLSSPGAPVVEVPVVEVPGAAPCSARALSMASAEVMNWCQISAGKVPPSTGVPLKSVVIGTSFVG
jgi:DNA-3-methyladenine glycosylase